jgi:hypothetical protein
VIVTREDLGALFGAVFLLSFLLWGSLLVVFGEVTVRRLRRDPATRGHLGHEFLPGWDIVNVAVALSWPRRLKRRLDRGMLGGFHANTELMLCHTSLLDRILARAFYWTVVFSVLWLLLFTVLARLW